MKRLRVHGLIKKVGRTYTYYLTALGKQVIALGLKLYIIPPVSGTGPLKFLPTLVKIWLYRY